LGQRNVTLKLNGKLSGYIGAKGFIAQAAHGAKRRVFEAAEQELCGGRVFR